MGHNCIKIVEPTNDSKFHYRSSETDGHRTIGRTWHGSRWKNSALVEAISWSTRNLPPLHHPEMIRSPLPLTIRCWYLCLATLKPYLLLAGRSRPRHGQPCSSGSSRGNRSVTSRVITACRLRRSRVDCGPRVAAKGGGGGRDHHPGRIPHAAARWAGKGRGG